MSSLNRRLFDTALKTYSKTHTKILEYGTAGFRTKGDELGHVMFRMGILAVLRSCAKNSSTVGLMITASHNPEEDNGVKLVDPMGEMLEQSWEELATKLANVEDSKLELVVNEIISKEKLDVNKNGYVALGMDTRPSSKLLCTAASTGIAVMCGNVKDYGVVTTPMLHYFVRCLNTNGDYGEATEKGYFMKISNAFKLLIGENSKNGNYKSELEFDGANGVGAVIMTKFLHNIKDKLTVNIYNDQVDVLGQLNHMCGSDYVKVHQKSPNGIKMVSGARCVSVDGDADRVVYYYIGKEGKFHLLDGDRIAILVAGYLQDVIKETKFEVNLGIVQTAYANGNSTDYIQNTLGIPVACVSTGVKHLHHKALDYDVGIYFEANGHGTVIFSDKIKELIRDGIARGDSLDEKSLSAIKRLAALVNVVNETVGDAISDMLLVEVILHAKGWSIQNWEEIYTDLPSRLLKVTIKDRSVVKTTDAGRICTSPVGLQDVINDLVKQFKKGRSFVRPSGTEDVVRVYAEADTQANADSLAEQVAEAVKKFT